MILKIVSQYDVNSEFHYIYTGWMGSIDLHI